MTTKDTPPFRATIRERLTVKIRLLRIKQLEKKSQESIRRIEKLKRTLPQSGVDGSRIAEQAAFLFFSDGKQNSLPKQSTASFDQIWHRRAARRRGN